MGLFPRACQPAPHGTAGTRGSENTNATHARRAVQFSSHCPPSPPPPHALLRRYGFLFRKDQWVFVSLPVPSSEKALVSVFFDGGVVSETQKGFDVPGCSDRFVQSAKPQSAFTNSIRKKIITWKLRDVENLHQRKL